MFDRFDVENRPSEGPGHVRDSPSLTTEFESAAMATVRSPPPPRAADESPAEARAPAAEDPDDAIEEDLDTRDWITSSRKGKPKIPTAPFETLKTVVIRAPNTLNIAQVRPYEILQAIASAANLAPHEQQALTLQIRYHQNVILLRTSNEFTAQKVAAVTTLSIQARIHIVKAYVTAPVISCRGVIHGIEKGLSDAQLLESLESWHATILSARMMGDTESVLITFEGTHVPRNILFRRVLYRCKPERPNALKCNRCREYGHRVLNCPHPPTYQRCPTCSTQLNAQDEPHRCSAHCFHCGGNHPTFDKTCPVQKQQDQKSHKAAYDRRKSLRTHLELSKQEEHKKPSKPGKFTSNQASTARRVSSGHTSKSHAQPQTPPSRDDFPPLPPANQKTAGPPRPNPWHPKDQEQTVLQRPLLKPATLPPPGEPSPPLPPPPSTPFSYTSLNPTPVLTSDNYMQHIKDRNDPLIWYLAEEISAIRQAFELMHTLLRDLLQDDARMEFLTNSLKRPRPPTSTEEAAASSSVPPEKRANVA